MYNSHRVASKNQQSPFEAPFMIRMLSFPWIGSHVDETLGDGRNEMERDDRKGNIFVYHTCRCLTKRESRIFRNFMSPQKYGNAFLSRLLHIFRRCLFIIYRCALVANKHEQISKISYNTHEKRCAIKIYLIINKTHGSKITFCVRTFFRSGTNLENCKFPEHCSNIALSHVFNFPEVL